MDVTRLLQPEPGPDRGRQGWGRQDHHGRGPGPSGRRGRALGPGGRARRAHRGRHRLRQRRAPRLRRLGPPGGRGVRRRRRTRTTAGSPSRRGTVRARTITPDDALLEYLADHGLRRVSKRLLSSGIVDLVAGAIPGIRDILVLGKVKQIERSGIGRPGPGGRPGHRPHHDLPLLGRAACSTPPGADRSGPRPPTWSPCSPTRPAARSPWSPCPRRCRSTRSSRPPTSSRTRSGIALGPVIVNGCYPPSAGLDTPAATRRPTRPGSTSTPRLVDALEEARRFRLTPPGAPGGAARTAGPRAAPPPAPGAVPLHRRHRPGRARRRSSRPWRAGIEALHDPAGVSVTSPATDRPRTGRHDRRGGPRPVDRHLLRLGRRRQDDHGGRPRPPGRPARPPGLRGDHRPGPPAGQLARPRRAHQPAHPDRGALARRAPRPHARPQGDLRRPGPAVLGHRRAGRGHQGQPDLPQPHRHAVGHPGVHGHGEALRAGRGGRVRPGGGGHATDAQRPRLPRRARGG